MENIGKVINIDFEGLYNWRLEDSNIDKLNYLKERERFANTELDINYLHDSKNIIASFRAPFFIEEEKEIQKEKIKFINERVNILKSIFEYSLKYNNPIQVYYKCSTFVIIGWSDNKVIIPKEFITIEEYPDYSDILPSDIPALLGENSITNTELTTQNNKSKKQLTQDIEKAKEEIQIKEKELNVELENLRKELRKKEEELRLQMKEKIDALQEKKKEFESQLFNLDYQLYSLRCLLGDSIEVIQLRKGKGCPEEQPVILYQKLRFLDEDLAKIKVIYCHNYDDESYVEDIFAKDDIVFEQFCPSTKCVSLFRISKDNTYYAKENGNTLERLMYTNGTRIGILVRDGDNLYLIWTEKSKIYLKENFLYNPSTSTHCEEDRIDENEVITNNDYMNKKDVAWVQFFSRKFLFNILQGLIQYKKILKFPENVDVFIQSPYIIFSTADNQITDNRFGTLSEFMKSRNNLTKVGDYVLPIMSIRGSYIEKSMWSNGFTENHERGRGYKNRVQDCIIEDKVQQINLIEIPTKREYLNKLFYKMENGSYVVKDESELDENEKIILNEYKKAYSLLSDNKGNIIKDRVKVGNIVYSILYENAGKSYIWKDTNTQYRFTGRILKETFFYDRLEDYLYYISVDKPETYNSNRKENSNVRSNVQIYTDEFINLTYLSSSILKYFITTKNIGNYFKANFAYTIKYLHKALSYIENRESKEYELISKYISINNINNIDLILIDWKYQNRVREITDKKAKKFAEYLKSINIKNKLIEIESNIDWKK